MILIGRGLDFTRENEINRLANKLNHMLCSCQGTLKKLTISGGNDEGVTPVPIPNTEVKPFSADGT